MPTQTRQLAAIMFTDIVGYTALMGKNSAKALELVRISKEIQKPLVEQRNGKWLKEMGDGALAQFSTAFDAVICAIEIQKYARAELDAKLRIGIHLGDITFENDDVYGDGVNIAARLESIADPGGIYISESIEKAIHGQSDIQAQYLGEIQLKNVDYGVRTYAVQGVGLPVPDLKKSKEISGRFLAEINRRGVIRAGSVYILVALLLILIFPIAFKWVTFPDSFRTMLLAVLGIGFPIAVYLAWRFERSPEGFVRTTSKQSWQNPYKIEQRKPLTNVFIIIVLVLVIIFLYLSSPFFSADEKQTTANSDFETPVIEKSIAFLPLENISDEGNEYLAGGLKSEIDKYLRKIPNLRVYSGLDVERLMDKNMSKKEIANELRVSNILEGTVWKEQTHFILNIFLTDVNLDKILWDKSYDEEYELAMEVVSEVAKNLATSLQIVLSTELDSRLSTYPTTSPEAYDLNLKAWQTLSTINKAVSKNEKDSLRELSRSYAAKALEYDSNYIDPLHLIANLEAHTGNFDAAKIITDKLIEKFPDEQEGYRLNAGIYFMNYDFDKAFDWYQMAYTKDPDDPWNNKQLGRIHCYLKNDYKTGIPYLIKSSGMPSHPGDKPSFAWLADAYMSIGDYEKAIQYSRRDLKYESSCQNLFAVFDNYFVQGKYEQCLNFLDSICTISTCDNCDPFYFILHTINGHFKRAVQFTKLDSSKWEIKYHIAFVNMKTGDIKEGKDLLNELILEFEAHDIKKQFPGRPYITDSRFHLAEIYSLLSKKKKALAYLKKSEERGFWYGHHDEMMSSPTFDWLKDNSEFIAIYDRVQREKGAIKAKVRQLDVYESY